MSATLPAGPGVATAPLGPVPVASGPLKVAEANLWQAQFAGADLRDATKIPTRIRAMPIR